MDYLTLEKAQRSLCEKFETEFVESEPYKKVGISENALKKKYPVHGLRVTLEADTTGWYIWADEELSNDNNFFQPLHSVHLEKRCPVVQKYLGLGPGWRFLIAEDYEDVWFDNEILEGDLTNK